MYSFAAARARGWKMLEEMSGDLHRQICSEWRYCERRRAKQWDDDVTLAVAIADVMSAVVGVLPVSIIAALLVKRGLNSFCSCHDDTP